MRELFRALIKWASSSEVGTPETILKQFNFLNRY